jgi:hypothetical protein
MQDLTRRVDHFGKERHQGLVPVVLRAHDDVEGGRLGDRDGLVERRVPRDARRVRPGRRRSRPLELLGTCGATGSLLEA